MRFIVRPITRKEAGRYCELHPHAQTLPNSSKYYFALYINNEFMGLAVWGYGIVPQQTPKTYFGEAGKLEDYLELCRFFVINDKVPEHTASKFLAITHRILKKYTKVKWLFTYAAGFQGLLGTIYKASGYEYWGAKECRLYYIPENNCLIHPISLWHRYSLTEFHHAGKKGLPILKEILNTNCYTWCGYNFIYIYWLCNEKEKQNLLKYARHKKEPFPKEDDIKIWLEDENGFVKNIDKTFAKSVPIVKLKSKCDSSLNGKTPDNQLGYDVRVNPVALLIKDLLSA